MKQLASLGEYANATQLAECLGLSRSGLYALQRRGDFPAGIKLGRCRRWAVSQIKEWLEGLQASENGGQSA